MNARLPKKLLLSVGIPLLFFGVAELGLRLAGFHHVPRQAVLWTPTIAGYDGTFEYRLPTFPDPPGYLWRTAPDTPFTDGEGFRVPSLSALPESGRIRIAFLGGSTTQGQRHPYSERAIRILNAALGTNRYEALNAGCSSYSSHQSLLALRRWVLDRKPDLICVYHGWNDGIVAEDGFSDAEKDRLGSVPKTAGTLKQAMGRHLRVFQGLARLIELLDVSWPRPRVCPKRFEENLRAMVRLAARRDLNVVLFTRPALALDPVPPSESAAHENCLAIQRSIAASEPNASLFDANQVVKDLHERWTAGEFGPGTQIHQPDGLHLRPLGEQLLAEQLALFLAPEHADSIRDYLASPAYAMDTARRMLAEVMPREAVWFLLQVPAQDPVHPEACRLLAEATEQFEFADNFWQGCWGGSDPVFASKIAKLKRCLELRPDDFGVCQQLAFVCFHMDRPGEAAGAMAGFTPRTAEDRYRQAWLAFQSHVAARRQPEAIETARLLLHLNPDDAEARAFLADFKALPR